MWLWVQIKGVKLTLGHIHDKALQVPDACRATKRNGISVDVTDDGITIYVHCQKIYNLFLRALETGRKDSIWRAFLACFAACAN
jgi:hypothetical protein